MTSTLDAPVAAAPRTSRQQRVDAFVGDAMAAVRDVMVRHDMTYDEYAAVKQWLIELGEAGEWPLFLDVWFESTVEKLATSQRKGSKGAILGPFYLPDQVELPSPATLPMRDDEPGEPLVLAGQVRSTDGRALSGAVVDIWQADAAGLYGNFGLDGPPGTLRARVIADDEGRFEIHTILPAPYEIPKSGPCGQLIAAAGWSAFRPAHLHVLVTSPGHEMLISQLYFADTDYLDNDVASAVKDELVLRPEKAADGGKRAAYDFVLDPSA